MNYYRLSHSLERKVIGKYPQAIEGIYHTNVHDPHFLGNQDYVKLPDTVSVPGIQLVAQAKRTDLVSAFMIGLSGRRVVSGKLKELIEKNSSGAGVQFLETYLIHKEERLGNYWILHPYDFAFDVLDFSRSIFWIKGSGGVKLRPVTVNTLEGFNVLRDELVLPEAPFIEKPAIKPGTDRDFLVLKHVITGIDYYVSERLKGLMEQERCSGITFEPL